MTQCGTKPAERIRQAKNSNALTGSKSAATNKTGTQMDKKTAADAPRTGAGLETECSTSTIDPRGPRFGGAITTIVLAGALIFQGTTAGMLLLSWQTLVFALGAIVGLQAQPYGAVYRAFIKPHLGPPKEMEAAAPPRFAQAVGLVFLALALTFTAGGLTGLATTAIAAALAAAFLNAAFGLCLGCEAYLLGLRIRPNTHN
jgi:hypothetical protein